MSTQAVGLPPTSLQTQTTESFLGKNKVKNKVRILTGLAVTAFITTVALAILMFPPLAAAIGATALIAKISLASLPIAAKVAILAASSACALATGTVTLKLSKAIDKVDEIKITFTKNNSDLIIGERTYEQLIDQLNKDFTRDLRVTINNYSAEQLTGWILEKEIEILQPGITDTDLHQALRFSSQLGSDPALQVFTEHLMHNPNTIDNFLIMSKIKKNPHTIKIQGNNLIVSGSITGSCFINKEITLRDGTKATEPIEGHRFKQEYSYNITQNTFTSTATILPATKTR